MTTFLVTGASRGIGMALCETIVARGDRVIATLRDPFRAPEFLRTAPAAQVAVIGLDVASGESIRRAAAAVGEPVDVLVNNAGISPKGRQNALDMDPVLFTETMSVNVLAPLQVTVAFLPHLRRSSRARVATISSQMGASVYPGSDRLAYRISKAAVNKAMQGLANDLAPEGIAVAAIHPGWVRTDMGGPAASLSPAESAAGCLAVIDGLTMERSGGFYRWDGSVHPW
jgi:NAD(P)-dependent dehydrogenase (short-subunit alcohol dehydrogenase family)